MSEKSGGRSGRPLFRVALPAALAVAVLGGGGWTLGTQLSQQASARPAPARTAATRYDRVFGNVYYKVPAGYRAAQQQGGILMVRAADGNDISGVLLVAPGIPLTPAIRKQLKQLGKPAFVQNMAIAFGDLTRDPNAGISDPLSANDAAKDGYEAFALSADSFDKDANEKRFTIFVIVLTPDRVEAFMKIAYGAKSKLTPLNAGFNALVGSAEFRNAGGRPPSRLAPPLPTSIAAILPKPRAPATASASAPRSSGRNRGGGKCRIVERQMCSGGFGTGYRFCNTYPQAVCN